MTLAALRNHSGAEMLEALDELSIPLPSEAERGKKWHKRLREANWSVSFWEALVWELLDRREILLDGRSWLDDIDAERWVLWWMWQGRKPPEALRPEHFTAGYHRYLFQFLSAVPASEPVFYADRCISLLLVHQHGEKAVHGLRTAKDRRRALGTERVRTIDDIDLIYRSGPQMVWEEAWRRVAGLSARRAAHAQAVRLIALLEQASVDEKDLWTEMENIERSLGKMREAANGR